MPPKRSAESKPTTRSARNVSFLTSTPRIGLILYGVGVLTLVGLYYSWELLVVPRLKLHQLHLHTVQDRLVFAVRNLLPGLVTLTAAWFWLAFTRFSTGTNPLSGNDHLVELQSRVLTNTLEQFVLSGVNQLILATYLPEDKLRLLPLVALSFVLGRILFVAGYIRSPAHRTLGLPLTLIPTVGMLGYNVWFAATLGLTHRLGSSSSARI